jgi:hypothetical protein
VARPSYRVPFEGICFNKDDNIDQRRWARHVGTEVTNFLDIIHRLSLIKDKRRSGDWSPSPSSGKKGPIHRASPYLRPDTDFSLRNVVCILSRIDDG